MGAGVVSYQMGPHGCPISLSLLSPHPSVVPPPLSRTKPQLLSSSVTWCAHLARASSLYHIVVSFEKSPAPALGPRILLRELPVWTAPSQSSSCAVVHMGTVEQRLHTLSSHPSPLSTCASFAGGLSLTHSLDILNNNWGSQELLFIYKELSVFQIKM